jgi:hypothetical protein
LAHSTAKLVSSLKSTEYWVTPEGVAAPENCSVPMVRVVALVLVELENPRT